MDIDTNFIELIAPDVKYMKSYIEADEENIAAKIYEFSPLPDEYKKDTDSFCIYLNKLEQNRTGVNLRQGYVPYTTFWLVDTKNLIFIGQCNLRHFLNDSLRTFGGHIGYSIRASCWGRGYGTLMLKLLLPQAKKIGLTTVRLTCYSENFASARVMQKNNARFIGEVINRIAGANRRTHIYEIDLNNI